MPSTKITKRLRIFAGPNGSGKSTIIESIQKTTVNGRAIDFGVYVNADDIAKDLLADRFEFSKYRLKNVERNEFIAFGISSGLISSTFSEADLRKSFRLLGNDQLKLMTHSVNERLAQLIAAFLRIKLLENGQKLSFETVFSHKSKLEFMKEARKQGYRVYLYFVSTENPIINVLRIKEIRVKDGGHDVPKAKIVKRYSRTMDLLYEAAQEADQCYFFDNSTANKDPKHFAHFKVIAGKKSWDDSSFSAPEWFLKCYSAKVANSQSS